jgi:hypothetical protein
MAVSNLLDEHAETGILSPLDSRAQHATRVHLAHQAHPPRSGTSSEPNDVDSDVHSGGGGTGGGRPSSGSSGTGDGGGRYSSGSANSRPSTANARKSRITMRQSRFAPRSVLLTGARTGDAAQPADERAEEHSTTETPSSSHSSLQETSREREYSMEWVLEDRLAEAVVLGLQITVCQEVSCAPIA